MGFLDALLGRTKLPKPKEERLFAMSTAAVALEAAGLSPAGRMGIVFNRLPSGRFQQLESDIGQMLAMQGAASQPAVQLSHDELGFDWVVLSGTDFQESLAAIHLVATNLMEEGLGDLLLACVFRFEQAGRAVFWVYDYKGGAFYPFVPTGERQRDNSEELRLAALIRDELPIEPEPGRWYALWDAPV